MKQILLFLALSTTILFSSCEGDPGPQGPPGDEFLAQVFETTVDFQYDGNVSLTSPIVAFPNTIEVFESDAVLAYQLVGQDNSVNPPADVWEQLPRSQFFNDGTGDVFQYSFNHTFLDIQFVIDGNFDVTTLGSDFTNDQIFRVVIVPAEFASADLTMDDIMSNSEIEVINLEN
ncbi:collagen-like protein [Marixanthomonas spongiae]|uniref:Dihydrolipoamide dehydrogenase n=1 Tax=Marixanthomonas spongiae TaxID=2174845 RepID=A0A2U0I3J0_9FLAO|nr:collagen-like protein [Marixanthomonas spongiae]PVW15676.1 dihydrolipoamide dehydrogenase [Marixanthomonas spongiae]